MATVRWGDRAQGLLAGSRRSREEVSQTPDDECVLTVAEEPGPYRHQVGEASAAMSPALASSVVSGMISGSQVSSTSS